MHRYTVRGPTGAEREVAVGKVSPPAAGGGAGRPDQVVEVEVGGDRVRIEVLRTPGGPVLRLPSGRVLRLHVAAGPLGGETTVTWPGRSLVVARAQAGNGQGAGGGLPGSRSRRVRAQMPGRVVKVLVRPGERVAVGQGVVILEAMKMENEVKARRDGVISAVRVAEGDRVETGADLVEFE